jgi:general secretion pathway protein K
MKRRHMKAMQRGAAIITALLIVVVITGLAAGLIAQQSQALTRTERGNARAHAAWLAAPVLDYARDSIRQSFKPGKSVNLTQAWAQGIGALPVEGGTATGRVIDQGGLFNLNNLVKDGKASTPDIDAFKRLLVNLKLDPNLADAAADWIDSDDETSLPGGQENALYFAAQQPKRAANRWLIHPSELARAKGFDEAVMNRLAPLVTALPARTAVNVNTAPEEILAALVPELDSDTRSAMVRARQSQPFESITGEKSLASRFEAIPVSALERLAVTSDYLLVQLGVEVQGAQVARSALLKRRANAGQEDWPAIIWVQNGL